jgi:hypothetical protein
MITGSMQSIGSKIDNQTVQLAETKKVLEMLCTFMEEQKPVDRAQDERLRQPAHERWSLSRPGETAGRAAQPAEA